MVRAMLILLVASLMQNPYGRLWAEGVCIDREYYLYAASSQAKIVSGITLSEYAFLRGEKSSFRVENEQAAEKLAKELFNTYRATIVCVEEGVGGVSYYAYSESLGRGVLLFGAFVNFHVVVSGDAVSVGTPLIFGGY